MAAWALLIFIITLLPVVLVIWITGIADEPKRSLLFTHITRLWMRIFFFFTGCSLKIKGREYFRSGENYIVACNHNSLMDVPVTTPFIPGAKKTIAKSEMAKVPLFGLIYKRGSILVDRNNTSSRKDSFRKMKNVLALGMHMCIYPEGTRNRTALPLKPFHDGAFRLAVETGTPILPALLFNTKKILPPGRSFYFRPAKMEIHFLQPVQAAPGEDAQLLKEKIHDLMSNYYAEHQALIPG
jgi:1-acyl-sn-glycerol-3-phosphate acyltransferase